MITSSSSDNEQCEVRTFTPTLLQSFIPIIFLIVMLFYNVYSFGDDAVSGSNQIVLLVTAAVASLIAYKIGMKWSEILEGIVKSVKSSIGALVILLMIGALAGTWLLSGIVPMMIYYGLKVLNPTFFLFAACVVSAIVSVAAGSSWTTIATIGIALLGIGRAIGIDDAVTAGAIISGAYFGDKISPLSDTTNLAPAMVGSDLFTHIKYMLYTTIPSIVITLIIFLVMGFMHKGGNETADVGEVLKAIDARFNISPVLLLVPATVMFMIYKKAPAIPTLFTAAILGGVFALIFQPDLVKSIAATSKFDVSDGFQYRYKVIMKSMYDTIVIATGNETVDSLLKSKGMVGMLNTIWLVISAMIFGGVMESSGMLKRITQEVIKYAKSTASLIASTAGTCIFFNITSSDQYLAIVVPGRMYADTFKERDLKPEVLSRTLEDAGTVTSVLVPWNTCGAAQSSVLGVATLAYLPYCFFNIISPIMTVLFAIFNVKIRRYSDDKKNNKV